MLKNKNKNALMISKSQIMPKINNALKILICE